jgi:hypothetical protein
MTDTTDPRVDACTDALPGWQQAICRGVCQLVAAAGPQVTETIKRANRPASSWRAKFPLRRGHSPGPEGIITGCQVAAGLAFSHRSGHESGQFSREVAHPQVGAAGISAIDMGVVPTARELATSVETSGGRPVSGQLANEQVSSMNSGQTRGDLTPAAMTTDRPAQWPSGTAKQSAHPRWSPCSG